VKFGYEAFRNLATLISPLMLVLEVSVYTKYSMYILESLFYRPLLFVMYLVLFHTLAQQCYGCCMDS